MFYNYQYTHFSDPLSLSTHYIVYIAHNNYMKYTHNILSYLTPMFYANFTFFAAVSISSFSTAPTISATWSSVYIFSLV